MIPIDFEQDTLHCLVLILERDKGEELTTDKHKGRAPQSRAQISLTPLPIRIYGLKAKCNVMPYLGLPHWNW